MRATEWFGLSFLTVLTSTNIQHSFWDRMDVAFLTSDSLACLGRILNVSKSSHFPSERWTFVCGQVCKLTSNKYELSNLRGQNFQKREAYGPIAPRFQSIHDCVYKNDISTINLAGTVFILRVYPTNIQKLIVLTQLLLHKWSKPELSQKNWNYFGLGH